MRRDAGRAGAWRPAHRRRVAYPGGRQEPDYGLLCRFHRPRAGHGDALLPRLVSGEVQVGKLNASVG